MEQIINIANKQNKKKTHSASAISQIVILNTDGAASQQETYYKQNLGYQFKKTQSLKRLLYELHYLVLMDIYHK